jgi:hypothetical protein
LTVSAGCYVRIQASAHLAFDSSGISYRIPNVRAMWPPPGSQQRLMAVIEYLSRLE